MGARGAVVLATLLTWACQPTSGDEAAVSYAQQVSADYRAFLASLE